MKNRTKISVLLPVLLLCLMLLHPVPAFAATGNASVSVSASSVTAGSSVTVTVSAGGTIISGAKITVSFPSSVFNYVSFATSADCKKSVSGNNVTFSYLNPDGGSVNSKTLGTITLSVKSGLAVGTKGSIQVSFAEISDTDGQTVTPAAGSSTVTVKAAAATSKAPTPTPPASSQAASSGNTNLASLSIAEATMNRSFLPTVTEYNATAANSVTSLTVRATAADSHAKVTISGGTSLKVGVNYVVVKVTAQNGATRQYNIAVNRLAAGESAPPVSSAGADSSEETVSGISSQEESALSEDSSSDESSAGSSSFPAESAPAVPDLSGWVIHAAYIGGMRFPILVPSPVIP